MFYAKDMKIFHRLGEDPPALVEEFLSALRVNVLQNKRLPRKVKNRFFGGNVLDNVRLLVAEDLWD